MANQLLKKTGSGKGGIGSLLETFQGDDPETRKANETYILCQQSLATNKQEGLARCREMIIDGPPLIDKGNVLLIQRAVDMLKLSAGTQLPEEDAASLPGLVTMLWEKALKVSNDKEDFLSLWFEHSVTVGDWLHAQKAAMTLQRTFLDVRKYFMWAVLSSYMLSISPVLSDNGRKLFGTLAYKQIEKAAAETKKKATKKEIARTIQTPQELHLLLTIYAQWDHTADAAQLFDRPAFAMDGSVIKNEWSVICKRLRILERVGRYDQLWDECLLLLQKAFPVLITESDSNAMQIVREPRGDDWLVWSSFTIAALKHSGIGYFEKAKAISEKAVQGERPSRNAQLALLELYFGQLKKESSDNVNTEYVRACEYYLVQNAKNNSCFADLEHHLNTLTSTEVAQLVASCNVQEEFPQGSDQAVKEEWAVSVTNLERLRFFLYEFDKGSPEVDVSTSISRILKALGNVLKMANRPERVNSDVLPGTDLAIVAVMHHVTQDEVDETKADLRAAAVLERVLEESQYDASALIILTRLYVLIGAPALASRTFSRLNVKSVQYDTLGFHLFTRMSTFHPHMHDYDDPFKSLSNALEVYFRAEETVPAAINTAISKGKYYTAIGMSSLTTRYNNSISKPLFMIEQRRIIRLIGRTDVDPGKEDFIPDPQIMSFCDNRDTEVVPNLSPSMVQPFETALRAGPRPEGKWIEIFTLVEHLADILESGIKGMPSASQFTVAHIYNVLDELVNAPDFEHSGFFTLGERCYLSFVNLVARSVKSFVEEGQTPEKRMDLLGEMEKAYQEYEPHFLVDKLALLHTEQGPEKLGVVLSHEFFHASFMRLDAMKMGSLMISFLNTKLGAGKDKDVDKKLQGIRKIFEENRVDLCNVVKEVKSKLSESGVLQYLVDMILERTKSGQSVSGLALEELVDGEAWVETFASCIMESWESGLNGILKVKLSE